MWHTEPGPIMVGHEYLITRTVRLAGIAAELRHSEELLVQAARQDTLTGIANRSHFFGRLATALDAPPADGRVAVLYLDLDGFKLVNDAHGHAVGDGQRNFQ